MQNDLESELDSEDYELLEDDEYEWDDEFDEDGYVGDCRRKGSGTGSARGCGRSCRSDRLGLSYHL